MLASALEDEETQDKGIVLVVWNYSLAEQQQAAAAKMSQNNASSSLLSWGAAGAAGIHQAVSSFFDSFWNLWKFIQKSFRIERLHYLTISSMMSIGISFPLHK